MTDFAAIADAAVAVIGSADPAQFETAYAALSTQTHQVTLPENWESELAIMSRLGPTQADAILTKIEAAVPARLVRLIQSERGVNLADPQTIGLVSALVGATVLSQAEADDLLASNTVTELKFPGVTRGKVSDALTMRAAGEV